MTSDNFAGENPAPSVAIAIVTWNNAADICDCLTDLVNLPDNWQVWVVDNNSADETVSLVSSAFPSVKLIANSDNKGFAAACNQVISATDTDFVLLLNPDTRATAEVLVRSLRIAARDESVGILGVRIEFPDGSLQTTCFNFPTLGKNAVDSIGLYRFFTPARLDEMLAGDFFSHQTERSVDWLIGAFMLVRRDAIRRAGPVPEDYFMFAEDLDFCWQVRRNGFDVRFSPDVSIIHSSNKSAGQLPSGWRVERTTLSKYLFCLKNLGQMKTRLIQMSDLLGCFYRIALFRLRGTNGERLREERIYRRQILRAMFMGRRRMTAILQTR